MKRLVSHLPASPRWVS